MYPRMIHQDPNSGNFRPEDHASIFNDTLQREIHWRSTSGIGISNDYMSPHELSDKDIIQKCIRSRHESLMAMLMTFVFFFVVIIACVLSFYNGRENQRHLELNRMKSTLQQQQQRLQQQEQQQEQQQQPQTQPDLEAGLPLKEIHTSKTDHNNNNENNNKEKQKQKQRALSSSSSSSFRSWRQAVRNGEPFRVFSEALKNQETPPSSPASSSPPSHGALLSGHKN